MRISVTLRNGRITFTPDVAHVKVGESVEWACNGEGGTHQTWTVKFDAGSPFQSTTSFQSTTQTTTTQHTSGGMAYASQAQVATIAAGTAVVPGDYKYGVAVRDSKSGDDLGEEDPRLIVQ